MVESATEPGATEVLAEFAVSGVLASEDHSEAVTRALVDTVAVSLGASGAEGDRILRTWARRESPYGPSTVWTSGETTTPSMAALVNGNAAHLLDYDDISPSMPLHPAAVLMPALVAVAEARGTSSERFIEAYEVGSAVFRAVADVLPQHVHYARGWHSTSTVGRLATVAALGRLVASDAGTVRNALGIVASLTAGSRVNFGTMTKPFHAGAAARDAVMALELAEDGFTANPDELDAPNGFLERYGDQEVAPVGSAGQALGERLEYWADAWPSDAGLKRYPSCYGTHRSIDAMLSLRETAPLAAMPTRITATVHPRGTRALRPGLPATGTQGKFSLEYTLAVAWLRGDVTLDDFTDATFADEEAQALLRRVEIGESAVPPHGPAEFDTGYSVVEVTFPDGSTQVSRTEVTHGLAADPLSDDELRGKFLDCCAAGGYDSETADRIIAAISAEPGAAFTSSIPKRSTE
ncbi:MmgE/PrpD family protein [Salinibacterium sp. GXW1014]|uniref:MmgE/PrpD family protein n=1 Tax=Salinibacterium sp. GXW1014 TaxID=3377838 RepID=UPI00383B6F9E